MTLLVTVFAAVITAIIWYNKLPGDNMRIGMLSLMYWGASLMWLVDAIAEFVQTGAEMFAVSGEDVLNDLLLGLSVVALGLVIWLVSVLIRDPKGNLRAALFKKK